MASDNEASCASDPNFAVICSFLGCFGKSCGIIYPDIARLQEMLENTQEVSQELINLHIKLLRKTRKTVSPEKWERALVKFCHTYSNQDGWELERFGYKKARVAVKLRLLKVLLETQFDLNQKFKNEVNKLAADELRVEPLGRDKSGLAYWCQLDEECNIRVYREDLDEENWELVAKDREGVINLISTLSNGEIGAIPINEDSNSLEISEKPIIDTGQVTTSPSLEEDEIVQENGVHVDEMKQLPNGGGDEFEDEREHDQDQDQDQDQVPNVINEAEKENEVDEEEEEDIDAEDDMTNDESSKQITEEDDSQETQTPSVESRCTNDSSSLPAANLKTLNMKVYANVEETNHRETTDETSASSVSESKSSVTHKPTDTKAEIEESAPLKSIETPVITSSPLKLINIADLKQSSEEKLVSPTSVIAPLNAAMKHGASDEMTDSVTKPLEKLSGKNSLPFSSTDSIPVGHSKLSIKPIDQLAANLVRIQSEKLEKPSGPKSLEKIAESLARSSGMLGNMVNGEDDRLPQDFCARNQSEKSATHRSLRGIDLSTSPRGWENANEQNRPVDFSGIDLSSRKLGKTMDLPSPGYRTQDFQHREMDLSTKKASKPEVSNLPYDARSVMLRNHVMVADLSKRQMPFTAYETPYHNTARLPAKDEHRLPSYAILSDPSKITTLRMNNAPLKRPMEDDDVQPDMLKRIRADVIPIRGSMDKRPVMSGNWRDDVSEAIEEPIMMVQGEGSGSDCDAVNPIVGEATEEPTAFFYGEGSGTECETGNPGDDAPTDNKESNESKTEPDSATTALSQNKVLTEDKVSAGSILSNKTPVKLNRNYPQSNVSINDNYQIVGSMQEKPKFKHTLGVQIIPKSTTGPVKRLSRWDVGKPEEKKECESSIISNEGDISLKKNTDEHGNVEEKPLTAEAESIRIGNAAEANQGVKGDDLVNADSGTVEDSVKLQVSEISSENTSTLKQEGDSTHQESVQCDSSISSCQADTSQELKPPCTDPESTTELTNTQNSSDSSGVVSREPDNSEVTSNECKPAVASLPRFFFGPNCISYTSKSDEPESQTEQSLTTSVNDKTDTVQSECVSSSKPADDTVYSYKTEDFDLSQTNNNSLKSDLFTSESDGVLPGNNSEDMEKVEAPNDTWDQTKAETSTSDSSIEPNVSEDGATKSSLAQVQEEASEESGVQESVCADKEVEEDDCTKLRTSPTSDVVTGNERNINDISTTEEDSIQISSNSKSNVQSTECGVAEPSQCDQSPDSENLVNTETREDPFKGSDDVTSQLLDDKESRDETSLADSKNENDFQSDNTSAFKEEQNKIESEGTAHSSLSPLADLREFEDVNNSSEPLGSTNAMESTNYHEASRLEKTDLDSIGESCDKQSDKNDNFSEIDGQEDHSTDTDNEKMKGMAGSDADSLCVNYDKNSERTDALSDVGTQDDGSGDSEEIKDKGLNDVQVNDTVFDIDSEAHLPESSVATSSESVRESDKHDVVPTINSSDDVSAQDSSSQESEPARMNDEKVENTSSDTDKPSTFNISPVTVPEINFEQSKSDIIETVKETSSSNLVQSTSEYADNAFENPSSCVDQDSNSEMVIDDRVSESNESFKETEEAATSVQQSEDATPEDTMREMSTEHEKEAPVLTSIEQEPCQSETDLPVTETEILEKEKSEVDAESKTVDDHEELTVKEENETCNVDKPDTIATEDVCKIDTSEQVAEDAKKLETDATTAAVEQTETNVADVVSQESQAEAVNVNTQSLVANYDSDSNDNVNDNVFESDVTQITDSKDDADAPIEQEANEEPCEKSPVKEEDIDSTNLISDVPQEPASAEQQIEPLETKVDEVSNQDAAVVIEEDVKIREQECVDEKEVKSACNDIEYSSNDQSAIFVNKDGRQEETDIQDISATDESKMWETSDVTKLSAAPVTTEEITESLQSKDFEMTVSQSEKSREYLNNSIDDMKAVQDIRDDTLETTEKTDCLTSENVCNFSESDVSRVTKVSFTQESTEVIATDNQVTGAFHIIEQEKNVEKLYVSSILDIENIENNAKSKNVNELVTEEQPVPCKRFKEDLADRGNEDNKWDVKSREECLTKPPAEETSLSPVQTESDIVPAKVDNTLDTDKSRMWKTEGASLEGSVSTDALCYSNSMSTKVDNVNNLDSCNNQNEPFSINVNVNKITENFDRNEPSDANNELTTFSAQEIISEIDTVKSDLKKEASKRLIDASDIDDVPPLKSKPPYVETDDKTLESLTDFDLQTPKILDTSNEAENLRPQIEDETRASTISTTQLFQNDFGTVNDSAATAVAAESTEEPKKIDLETDERKESLEIQDVEMKNIPEASDDSTGVDNEDVFDVPSEEANPLECTDDDALRNITEDASDASKISVRVKPATELAYEGWKLDSTVETPKVSRKRRNSAHESNSEDGATKQEDEEMKGSKRMKLRAKRMPDKELRKTIEESRGVAMSSEDEAVKCGLDNAMEHANKDGNEDPNMQAIAIDKKIRGRPRGRRRRGFRGGGRPSRPKLTEFQGDQASSGVSHPDGASNDALSTTQKKRKKRKMVLGLEIGRDISLETEARVTAQDETPVRQSRRIAQLKIKEQADRRRIEEETLREIEDKKESSEKKKRKKQKPESEEEIIIKEIEKEKKSKKKRRKKKKMLAKFNEANPWQSSSGSNSDEENENEDEEEEDEDMESEGSLLFKSDHEFSPESDLEKDQESEPLRRARTAQKAQIDVEEAEDEYACQKCGKADHPEWILLCDSCDKGWHCSCLRPALMLIPEGDWFCPPCQHTLLVTKLRETLKTLDQLTKRHENEVLRKKRLAFVGISLDNVLHKGEGHGSKAGSQASSQESDNESSDSSSSASSSETSNSEDSEEPVYQLRERRCANTYKFNEYDDMINAAIQDEVDKVEAVQGAGNQGRGKDIATIVNAEKEEAQAEALKMTQLEEDKDDMESKPEKESDEEYKVENEDTVDEIEEEQNTVARKLLARKKHRKLNSLDISSEDDPDSDEDFKGSSSDEEEDFDDHVTSSDDSYGDLKRRGRKGESRPVRRSTRARMTRAYDEDFINDDSEESDRPKRKKSRSMWGDSDSEDSDNSWRQRKKKSRTISTSRVRTVPKTKGKKKKKRKRIIESDNQSENDEDDEPKIEEQCEPNLQDFNTTLNEMLDVNKQENLETSPGQDNIEIKDERLPEAATAASDVPIPQIHQPPEIVPIQKIKKDIVPKPKKATIRRKIIYGGLPDENRREEEEILSRRTRGRKINYREEMASDSEEELKKALMMRKVGESEEEYVNEADDINDDGEKDSDSGDVYIPKKDALKFKNKSLKTKKSRNNKSSAAKRKSLSDDLPKQRKKPGPKPGSKNKGRMQKLKDDMDGDIIGAVMDNPIGDIASKMDENLPDNVALTGTTMSVASSFAGDVPEGSLTGLGAGELADLDDEQLEQMMMDEEYGRRQLELAAIEIAKKKKKEEREAKKLEKARLKALEILAAERQRDPNAPEGTDGEVPRKKKRGRRSKAEILAEQMRRDGTSNLGIAPVAIGGVGTPDSMSNMSHNISPVTLSAGLTPETDRSIEGQMPLMTGPDGQLFNPDGTPVKPKRRGRGKGKKTLALEAARAAEAAAKAAAEVGLIAGMGTDSNSDMKQNDIPNVLPTPGSSTSGSAPSTPPASTVPTPGPPSTQPSNSQPVYPSLPPGQQSSVITRMLQSQPVSSTQQSFTAAAAAMGHKYFGPPNAGGQMMGGPRTGYEMQPRARIPSPYRQAGQSSMPPHFAAVRSGTPPMRMRVPGSQMYHTPHHPMDPSPSGGGPISISNRDRSSPLTPGGPAMIPPSAGSPLAKGGPTPPPPPPYVRGGPPMARFAESPMGPRHQMPPFTNASPVNHNMQQPSPPPNRPPGNFSPYHPPPPPNYHYGAYPPPPPMSTADDAAAYQSSPYPSEHFSSPADNQPPIQGPPPPQGPLPQQSHPNEDDHGTGEFGGLVSYFSSQREDDLDS